MKHVFKKTYMLWAALLCVAQSAFATIPNGYYSKIDGTKKSDLKTQLKSCIANHTVLSYSSLWEYYEETDVVPGTTRQVFDYYSPDVYYFTGNGTAPSGANKEHSCPQSWWGKGSSCNAYSDLFNVLPSEANANSAKSNYPVGEVGSAKYSNGRIKVGSSKRSEYSGSVFEPADEHKGDFARIYFYIATIYSNANWTTSGTIPCAFVKEDYPTLKSAFIQMLLQWNRQDPVDEWEIGRQERVYSHQHNRNPFIDYPQLAEYIWGDSVEFAFDLSKAVPNLDMSGSSGGNGGSGGGNNGGGNSGGGNSGDDGNDPPVLPVGSLLFDEPFDDITQGSVSTGGCGTAWSGCDHFPTVESAYQAGGVVKLGSGSKRGSLTSSAIPFAGGDVVVRIRVKGWTSVEGDLKVSIGEQTKTLSYEAVLDDDFEQIDISLTGVQKNPVLKIETTSKRCFLDAVQVYVAGDPDGIEVLGDDVEEAVCYNLYGQSTTGTKKGCFYIRNGKKAINR